MRVVFWGTGNTAKEYIDRIKELPREVEVVAFTNGDQKNVDRESFWSGYQLIAPEMIPNLDIDYICILSIWEWEIRQRIYDENLFDLSRIISFQEMYMISYTGMEIEACYKRLLQCIHPLQVDAIKRWKAYEYLKRKYSYVMCDRKYWIIDTNKKVNFEKKIKPIWILWLQGFEQAPDLVKVCVQSVKRALGTKEHIYLLDEKNLSDYIELPDYILQKWKNRKIGYAHFSDIIRLRLLNLYGGVWIDATVYFTGNKLPDYIRSSKLFMFTIYKNWRRCDEPMIAANWLISSEPGNKMLIILEALLHEYWKNEDVAVNYVIFHIFWTMVVECFPEEWEQVEKILRDTSQLLCNELNCKFNEVRFQHLKRMTDIHKLCYRYPYTRGGNDSFWAKISEMN